MDGEAAPGAGRAISWNGCSPLDTGRGIRSRGLGGPLQGLGHPVSSLVSTHPAHPHPLHLQLRARNILPPLPPTFNLFPWPQVTAASDRLNKPHLIVLPLRSLLRLPSPSEKELEAWLSQSLTYPHLLYLSTLSHLTSCRPLAETLGRLTPASPLPS